jgi:flagellar biosynthesis repressor protein FlbT
MALKIALKPEEKVIIGGAVIQNGNHRSEFIVENSVPILRQKDIMREDEATTYCSKIYFAIQLMYVDRKSLGESNKTYWKLIRNLVRAVPSTLSYVETISEHLLKNNYYQALKAGRKLIDYEREVMNHVRSAS